MPRRWAQPSATRSRDGVERRRRPRRTRPAARRGRGPVAPSPDVADLEARRVRWRPAVADERLEQVELVVERPQPRGVVGDLVEPRAAACRSAVGAVDAARRRASSSSAERRRRAAAATGGGSGASVGHPLATRSQLSLERQRPAPAARSGLHPGGEQEQERALEVGVGEQLRRGTRLQRRSNSTPELTSSSTSTRGGSPASIGCSRQDALGERVQRADGGAVELVERGAAALADHGVAAGRRRPLLERAADPVAQLGAGLLGERDGGDRARSSAVAAGDEGDDPVRPARWSCPTRRRPRRTASRRGRWRCGRGRPGRAATGAVGLRHRRLRRRRRRRSARRLERLGQVGVAGQRRVATACAPTARRSSATPRPSGSQNAAVDERRLVLTAVGWRGEHPALDARRRSCRACRRRRSSTSAVIA